MANRPQSWQACDEDIKQFVSGLVDLLQEHLSDNLIGVYLHGSLAMGSYYRPKSDIDILVVVQKGLSPDIARLANQAIAAHAIKRPTTGDIELSVITANTAKQLPMPMPFELHYSTMWQVDILSDKIQYDGNKTDLDLNGHIMYIVKRGIVLFGKPIAEVFGEPSWLTFKTAILDDLDWIIEDEHILETPFYSVLNICRVLQLQNERDEQPHSKDEGGEWALRNLPSKYSPLIQQALDVYRSSEPVEEKQRRLGGQLWDEGQLLAFRDFARQEIVHQP